MILRVFSAIALICISVLAQETRGTRAADRADSVLERRFAQTVRPFLNTYCIGCHGGNAPAAQFDLRPYSTAGAVIRDYAQWEHVLERLAAGEMPPKPAKQLRRTRASR